MRSDANILSFTWSGSNSHAARQLAGTQLADFLLARHKSHPTERYYLICHSHGGNVALYAARQPAIRDIIEGIVFLGTPFIQGSARRVATGISPIITALVSAVFLLPMFLLIGGNYSPIVYAATVPLAMFLWLALRLKIRDRLASALVTEVEKLQKRKASDLLVSVTGMRCLVVYVPFDEARTWLRVLNGISNIPYFLWWFVARAAPWLLYALAFVAINLIIIDDSDSERHFLQNGFLDSVEQAANYALYAPVVAAVVFFLLPILSAAASILVRSSGIAFGYEGIYGHSLINITGSAIPDLYDKERVAVVRTVPSLPGLKHSSFYLDPHVGNLIAEWISHGRVTASERMRARRETGLAVKMIDVVAACAGVILGFAAAASSLQASEIGWMFVIFVVLTVIIAGIRWVLERMLAIAVSRFSFLHFRSGPKSTGRQQQS